MTFCSNTIMELWIAREILSKPGKPSKDAQLPTWQQYLNAVGLAKRTANNWLARLGELLLKSSSKGTFKKGGEKSLPKDINKKQSHYAQEIYRNPEIVHEIVAKK